MTSIIKPVSDGFEDTDLFKKLSQKGQEGLTKKLFDQNDIHKNLCQFLGKKISHDYCYTLTRTWAGALQFMGVVDKADVTYEQKAFIDPIYKKIDSLKKAIISWKKNGVLVDLHSMITDTEFDVESVFKSKELGDFIDTCVNNMNFGRGDKYSKVKIQEYGVFALFDIGEAIGLKQSGKPSSLYNFVNIITLIEPKQLSEYYQVYKEISIPNQIRNNEVFSCIYPRDLIMSEIQKFQRVP